MPRPMTRAREGQPDRPMNAKGSVRNRNGGVFAFDPGPVIHKAVKAKDVSGLAKFLFDRDVSPGEADIIRAIVFDPERRVVITAHTRYGKTWAVAIAVLMWVLFHPGHEVDIVSPLYSQSSKLMEYIADNIVASPVMRSLVDAGAGSIDRLKTEVSKRHITFKNGAHVRILSGEGTGDRLMGHGGQLLVIDESCLLDYEVYRTKVSRMEEDAGHGDGWTKIVHIGNPWHKGNQFFEAWSSPKYRKVHIDWKQGIDEGRISWDKVEEQRETLSPLEFTVLYESQFPDSAEDALIKYDHLIAAKTRPGVTEGVPVWALDVAEKGTDRTILTRAIMAGDGDRYGSVTQEELRVDDTMQSVAEVRARVPITERIYIDTIGIGAGVASRLIELGYNVVGVRVSRTATDNIERFTNQKAQFYWRVRDLFESGRISLPHDCPLLIRQLSGFRWEIGGGGKIKIIDPDGPSPDHADSLMLCVCNYAEAVAVVSIGTATRNTAPASDKTDAQRGAGLPSFGKMLRRRR